MNKDGKIGDLNDSTIKDSENIVLNEGVIHKSGNELFYKPITEYGNLLYSTDIYNLGSVFDCDWQGKPKINTDLIPTSYQLPPLVSNDTTTGLTPLLFDIDCINIQSDAEKSRSIRRLCEIGVGLDEVDEFGNPSNKSIGSEDISNTLLRSNLIKLNNINIRVKSSFINKPGTLITKSFKKKEISNS